MLTLEVVLFEFFTLPDIPLAPHQLNHRGHAVRIQACADEMKVRCTIREICVARARYELSAKTSGALSV